MTGFTARASARQACFELLDAFKTASGQLNQVSKARPGSYGQVPVGFVGAIRERDINRDSGLRIRTPVADVFLVFGTQDNEGTADLQDAAVDAFMDYCDQHLDQADPKTLLELIATEDVDLSENTARGPIPYIATRCSLRLTVQEGRL